MTKDFELKIINLCNDWKNGLDDVDISLSETYEISKNKLRNLWLQKTGEFLKLSVQLENQFFAHIVNNLSKKFEVSNDLINEYLLWCFNHMDFFREKYKEFSVSAMMKHADQWDRNLFTMPHEEKITLLNLKHVTVSSNIFLNCEKYGISLVATKLQKETKTSRSVIETQFKNKLISLSDTSTDILKLKKMLMKTVENSPYTPEIIFNDYKDSLREFFDYFSGEPWCQL